MAKATERTLAVPDKRALTAPCGIDCFNCEVYVDNITEQAKQRLSACWKIQPEQTVCRGCREQKGCRLHYGKCDTLECVNQKQVEFCFECADFPCSMLQPAANLSDRLPHNMKVFNLCRIKAIGVEAWAEQESRLIRQRYFKGKMVVGKGPILE